MIPKDISWDNYHNKMLKCTCNLFAVKPHIDHIYIFIILYINNVIYKITTLLVQCKLIDRTIALKTTRKIELIKSEAITDKTYKQ